MYKMIVVFLYDPDMVKTAPICYK